MKKRARLFVIGLLPILAGILLRVLLGFLKIHDISVDRIEFVLNSLITFASALSGFILSSLSILIGLSNSPIMVHIRTKGAIPELRCRYTSALLYCIMLIIYCVCAGMAVGTGTKIDGFSFTAAIALITAFLFSTIVTGKYLLSLIAIIPAKKPVQTSVYAPKSGFKFYTRTNATTKESTTPQA